MYIYLDTANDDFVLGIFDEKYSLIDKIVYLKYPKKVNLLCESMLEILKRNNIEIANIKAFYTNLGPGYFTGVRISLVYLRTIALMLNKPIYTISTMQILQQQKAKDEYIINANGGKYYSLVNENNEFNINQITIKDGEFDNYDAVDSELMLNNFKDYLKLFKQYQDLMDIEPYYIKKPQIGAKK